MSPRATMSAERLLSIFGIWLARVPLTKLGLHDFVVQELASLLHHRMCRIAEKSQHARGLTILYPCFRADTHHGDFAAGLCYCSSKMRSGTFYLKRRTPLNRTYTPPRRFRRKHLHGLRPTAISPLTSRSDISAVTQEEVCHMRGATRKEKKPIHTIHTRG